MPHLRKGRTVYKKVNGLKKVQTCESIAKAKRALRLQRAIHHGWEPTGKPAKR